MKVLMMPRDSRCDKCGREVPPENDIAFLGIEMGNPEAAFALSRHLLPVVEDGKRVCEGSPSRAQYLEGQPRDTRGLHPDKPLYPYLPKLEAGHREAYSAICERAEMERRLRLRNMN